MAKARRKMRRALMKKMRKGALTPGERRDLMELDREVNRANRQAAGVGGAGLAAALAIASKTGALGKGKDALGDFLDERAGVREERKGQKAIEKEEKLEAKERYAEGREDMREARQEMREERREQRKADAGFDPYIEAVRNMDGSVAVGPANEKQGIRERRQEEMEQRKEDRLDRRLERRGGYDPRTGEVVDSAKQRAADEEFDREFDEFIDKEGAEEELAYRVDELRNSGMKDREIFEKLKKEGNLPGSITGDSYVDRSYSPDYYDDDVASSDRRTFDDPFAVASPMAMMSQIRKNERIDKRDKKEEEKKSDRIQKQIDFVNKYGGRHPITGEYIDSPEQIAADKKFDREFDQAFPDEEVLAEGQAMIDRAMPNLAEYNRRNPYTGRDRESGIPLADQAAPRAVEQDEMPDPDSPVMTRQGMDLDTMIRLGGRGRSEGDREAGLAAELSDYSPEEIESLIRYDLRQADGGTTPFLRKMRDRIRKKFR